MAAAPGVVRLARVIFAHPPSCRWYGGYRQSHVAGNVRRAAILSWEHTISCFVLARADARLGGLHKSWMERDSHRLRGFQVMSLSKFGIFQRRCSLRSHIDAANNFFRRAGNEIQHLLGSTSRCADEWRRIPRAKWRSRSLSAFDAWASDPRRISRPKCLLWIVQRLYPPLRQRSAHELRKSFRWLRSRPCRW